MTEIGKAIDVASEQIIDNFPVIINLTEKMFSEMVLILACITPERETIINFLKEQLADYDYWSNPHDLSKSDIRQFIKANFMFGVGPKFIIVDLTNTDLFRQELVYIFSEIPPTPILPILQDKNFLDRFKIGFIKDSPHWILPPYCYRSLDKLAKSFERKVIVPAEAKAKELRDGKEMKFGEII